jgi:anti-sigma-K factor RskA
MANPTGQGVISAGVAPAGQGVQAVRFKVPDPKLLRNSSVLGLSLEPAGGSPSATHVLGFGKWTKVSG